MKFLKPYQQFINESLVSDSARELDAFSSYNQDIMDKLAEIDSVAADLMESREYWYNRESRNIRQPHYAVDVKLYKKPDLEEYQEATGDDEAEDDNLERSWADWLEMEIEDFQSYFLEEFSDFEGLRMGGSSGGWMCPVPDSGPEALIEKAQDGVNYYTEYTNELDERVVNDLRDYLGMPSDDVNRLIELGVITHSTELDEIVSRHNDALQQATAALAELETHKQAIAFIKEKFNEFEQGAKESFLDFARETN